MLPDRIRGFRLQRNPSWRSSATTGLRLGLWLAPSTLLIAVGRPLLDVILGLIFAVVRGISWLLLVVVLIVGGLAGFVTPVTHNQG